VIRGTLVPRLRRAVAPLLLPAVLACGCAVSGGTEVRPRPLPLDDVSAPVSPIRDSMRPAHRVFFDMLEGEGDWTLIEPHGYVFRPAVNFVAWRPYENGFWAPNDAWGWVWVSADRFGWATDHYGRWLYDRFQGWVWVPDIDWAPAWVSWVGDPDYVGWAPLMAGGGVAPAGGWTYAPLAALGATDLPARAVKPSQLGERVAALRPIARTVERDGVVAPAGPPIAEVERRAGPLRRVRVEDAAPPGLLAREPGDDGVARDPREGERAALDEARRSLADAASRARGLLQSGAPVPDRVPALRPFVRPPAGERPASARRAAPREARPDSTR
jgi:hypothetical protein